MRLTRVHSINNKDLQMEQGGVSTMIRNFSPNSRTNGNSFMELRTRGIPVRKEDE